MYNQSALTKKFNYLCNDELLLVISILLSGSFDFLHLDLTSITMHFAILAELQRTARCSTSGAVTVDLSPARVLAQLAGVTDPDVRREEDEKVAAWKKQIKKVRCKN